jgi:hypothetical protein
MWRRLIWDIRIDVSEETAVSIFRVEEYSLTLKMEAAGFFETSDVYTKLYSGTSQSCHREDTKCHIMNLIYKECVKMAF